MNKDKNKQLWITVNKLRGAISSEAVVKAMIYSLFLKYIEDKHKTENTFLFFDEKYSLDYLTLTFSQVISADDIKNYLEKAETELGINKGMIANDCCDLLKNSEPEKIRIIFGEVKSIDREFYGEYDEISAYLLEQLSLSNGKTFGEHITNPSLALLIKNLLDCQNGMTLYDGFCGKGVLANTVAAGKCSIYVQDISSGAVSIAAVLTVLSKTNIGNISCGDSLLNPMESAMKYDRIVIDPPLMPRYDSDYMKNIPPDNYFDVGTDDKDSIFVRHAIALMKDDGMAAVIVPMSLLFRSGRSGLSRELYASQYVDAVIELPTGIIPSTLVSAAVLILKKKKRFDDVFMINAKSFVERIDKVRTDITEGGIDEIVRIYRNREIIEGVSNSVSHETLLENEYNMCTTPYVTTPTTGYAEESVVPYIKKYSKLSIEVDEIDSRLTALRERFYE